MFFVRVPGLGPRGNRWSSVGSPRGKFTELAAPARCRKTKDGAAHEVVPEFVFTGANSPVRLLPCVVRGPVRGHATLLTGGSSVQFARRHFITSLKMFVGVRAWTAGRRAGSHAFWESDVTPEPSTHTHTCTRTHAHFWFYY